MRVLLTGASGLLGHNIIDVLLERNLEINAIVRRPEKLCLHNKKLKVFKGDFMNLTHLLQAAKNCDSIIHVASETDMSLDYAGFEKVNVRGSEVLLKVANKLSINNIVYISTANTIGYGTLQKKSTELDPIQYPFSESYYAQTKALAEKLFVDEAKRNPDKHIVILNPGFMLGAFDTKPSSGALVLAAYKKPLMFAPKGGKCFIHVRDVAFAAADALHKGKSGEKYLLGNYNLSIYDFYKIQSKVCDYKQVLFKLPNTMALIFGYMGDGLRKLGLKTSLSSNNIRQLCVLQYYDNSKAVEALDLHNTPLETTILDSVHWLKHDS
jgi:Nucleoside-diphosphate-sugar epimerases